ncbi:Hpt domain-containing protein (plasmid) [Nostoc sp. CENA543]|uniref:Hpt domain-containing protein n=1 Tax=Nostoc sp. CENA543 TaxID=1869241 RepID=UPI000CA21AFA|nr:Hpt domain-containing protein [Nostoc sp. CENA543]AUT04703.1 Hpt domain-containing protein [Nostoc sp. CENA543]
MPAQKKQSKKPPPSEMLRVPVALKDAVRELSRLHRQGRTVEVLQGIQELVNKLDSTADIDSNAGIQQLTQRVAQLESRLESNSAGELSEQLATMRERIEQLESAYNQLIIYLNSISKRKQSSSRYYQGQGEVKIDTYTPQNLAKRLGVDSDSLERMRVTAKKPEEFISWSRGRDPSGLGWRYNSDSGLYHPVR